MYRKKKEEEKIHGKYLVWVTYPNDFITQARLLLGVKTLTGPTVLAAGAGRVGYIFFIFFICLPFLS